MVKLSDKINTALDETRMLIMGMQILLGFQYRAVFETGFQALPYVSQYIKLAGLAVLLIAIGLIMWPSAYHRVVYNGNDDPDVHHFITTVMDIALLPIVITIALDIYVLSGKVLGVTGGIIAASALGLTGLFFLYGFGLLSRGWHNDSKAHIKRNWTTKEADQRPMQQQTPLHIRVEHVLAEARVVLPGATALLGFQFATMLLDVFDKLPASSRYVHLLSLWLMGLSVILLMTPAAYHRIVENGEDTERFHRVAGKLLLAAMVTLPIGMCGDLFVVVRKVTQSTSASIVSAAAMLSFFYGLWFGFTSYRRSRLLK